MWQSILKEIVNANCSYMCSSSLKKSRRGLRETVGFGCSFREWASSCGVEKFLASVLVLANALLEMGRVAVSQNPVIHPIMRVIFFVIANHPWGLLDFLGPEEVSGLAASPQPAAEFVVGPDLIPLKSGAVELESGQS